MTASARPDCSIGSMFSLGVTTVTLIVEDEERDKEEEEEEEEELVSENELGGELDADEAVGAA